MALITERLNLFKMPTLEWTDFKDKNGICSTKFGGVEYVLRDNPEASETYPYIVTYDGKSKEFSTSYEALTWIQNVHAPSVARDMGLLSAGEADAVDYLVKSCHNQAYEMGWWTDISTGEQKDRNIGEALMLIVSEVAEAMEGHRKRLPDDHLPQYPMMTVELADAIVRICDLAGGLRMSLGRALADKLRYNRNRADHQIANRLREGGKSY